MKRLLSLALTALILSVIIVPSAYAATPRWTNIFDLRPYIQETQNTYGCEVSGFPGTSKISCDLVLYEKNWLGNLTEVARTSGTSNRSPYECIGQYNGFSSSKTYVLEITASVTINGYTETVTQTYQK